MKAVPFRYWKNGQFVESVVSSQTELFTKEQVETQEAVLLCTKYVQEPHRYAPVDPSAELVFPKGRTHEEVHWFAEPFTK